MTTVEFAESKAALRTEVRAALAAMSPDERVRASERLFSQLESVPEWVSAQSVLLFAPTPLEPATDRLWSQKGVRLTGKNASYPRVIGESLEVRHVVALADLQIGRFGLREPNPDRAELIAPTKLDLVLVPGLAFTTDGARLGRGGGFFDRFLATLPGRVLTIGLAFECQLRDSLPEQAHDRRLHQVLVG